MPDDGALRNFVAKVDPFNPNERELFCGHGKVSAIQIKYSDSHWLLKEDTDLDQLVDPDQQLILADWEDEKHLIGRHPDDAFQRCIELEDYLDHVFLGDRWTYEDELNPRQNRKQINWSIGVQNMLGRRFEAYDVDFEFHPMLQGWKPWHLERHRGLLDEFGTDLVGFDATGYRSEYVLRADVNRAIDVLGIEGMYVSGRIGPTHLELLPSEVLAFSGKRAIIDEVKFSDEVYSRDWLTYSVNKRIRALDSPQTELRQFTTATS